MAFYLVSQRTEAGMEAARQDNSRKNYGLRERERGTPWMPQIYAMTSKVSGTIFEEPVPIRGFFKETRDQFCGGMDPNWDEWLNGDTSSVETLDKLGHYRFSFMDTAEFDALDNEQKARLGFRCAA